MLSAPTVRTEYRGYNKSYTDSFGDDKSRYVVQKRTVVKTGPLVKVGAFSILLTVFAVLNVILPIWMVLPLYLIVSFFYAKIFLFQTWKVERIDTTEIAKSLRDEAGECIMVLDKLTTAARLAPEGSGIQARKDQYGKMIWQVMEALQALWEANDLMSAKSGNFYRELTVLKNRLSDLERAGYSLVELTANRRMDNVVQEIEFIGINEFKEQVDIDMMTYRSIGRGDDN